MTGIIMEDRTRCHGGISHQLWATSRDQLRPRSELMYPSSIVDVWLDHCSTHLDGIGRPQFGAQLLKHRRWGLPTICSRIVYLGPDIHQTTADIVAIKSLYLPTTNYSTW